MTLQLELCAAPPEPIDVRSLTPDRITGMSLDAVRSLPLRLGRQKVKVGDLFRVSGAVGERVEFCGPTRLLNSVGAEMRRGSIVVNGDAGLFTASHLRGGNLHVTGNSGPGTASAMGGGKVTILGNVAEDCAAAAGADRLGMRGGVLVVHGNTGPRFAARMRRGTAIVLGTVGDDACNQMIAGTVVGLSGFGARLGLGMRRGTLVTRVVPEPLPAWFSTPERYVSSFSRMLVRQLDDLLPDTRPALGIEFQRYLGDLSIGGQGELLVGEE